jgi:C4-dicarboxylate-specific signal transduction histidine kinase
MHLSLAVACLLMVAPPVLAAKPYNVLVLYSFGRLLPANLEGDRGLRETFATRPDLPVTISFEYLDNLRFQGEAYDKTFSTYLRDKYASMPPDVILAAADDSLDFVLRHRSEMFARTPVVYMNVTTTYLRSIPSLPADVVGTAIEYDFVGTIEQALRWHPGTNRLVIVTGASSWDHDRESQIRARLPSLPGRLSVEFLAGLPADELQRRLRGLQAGTIVFTPGYFVDGGGQESAPRESVQLIAAASPVPVYGTFSTLMGMGIVGGRMATFEAVGRLGARTAIALLEGAAPAAVKPPATIPAQLHADWRQLERWHIPRRDVPPDTVVWFREPTLWESNRELVILSIAVILLQAGLIFALLLERRRRRATVAALARSEQHMRLAAQAAKLSSWVLDDEAASKAGAVGLKAAAPETGGSPLVDFRDTLARISPEDRPAVEAALRLAVATSGEFDAEYRVDAPDGECHWQAARGRADPAQASRLFGVAIDITQRKRAEAQTELDRIALYHMTRVSLLGQLSASIAHQLNQPLASIRANAEVAQKILEREPVDLQELREICADIVADDHRAAQVIRRLGALFRRDASQFEPLDLNELVRDSLDLIRSALTTRHATVITELAPGLPPVSGDRVQLQQLLMNLIINAADAMVAMGEGVHEVTISTYLQGDVVKLCVADQGPGVPADALEKVFEAFWTTRAGGMGMGLAVSRSIALAHNGSLTVTNIAPAGGARFCASLPAMVAP